MSTWTKQSIVPELTQEEFDKLPRAHKKRLWRAYKEDNKTVTIWWEQRTRTSVLTPQRMRKAELEAAKEMLAKIERGELEWEEVLVWTNDDV